MLRLVYSGWLLVLWEYTCLIFVQESILVTFGIRFMIPLQRKSTIYLAWRKLRKLLLKKKSW